MLDLPHHVVAEVANEPPVERRGVGGRRRGVELEQSLDGSQHTLVDGHTGREPSFGGYPAVTRDENERGVAPDEREATPAVAVLHRLEKEPGAVLRELEEDRHGGLEVGDDLT